MFTAAEAAEMRDVIWGRIERTTHARRREPASWIDVPPIGFKPIKGRTAFKPPIQSSRLHRVLDEVFGGDQWQRQGSGAQILVTFPSNPPWVLPHHLWHMDSGFGPVTPTAHVKCFLCVDVVDPTGGGTLALAGSHRLVDRYQQTLSEPDREGNAGTWGRFMRAHEWTRDLVNPGAEPQRTRRLTTQAVTIDGVDVRVVEMTGQPGDGYLTDLHTFHCVAPNTLARPRIMLGLVFKRRGDDSLSTG